jgi:hypothetical protein
MMVHVVLWLRAGMWSHQDQPQRCNCAKHCEPCSAALLLVRFLHSKRSMRHRAPQRCLAAQPSSRAAAPHLEKLCPEAQVVRDCCHCILVHHCSHCASEHCSDCSAGGVLLHVLLLDCLLLLHILCLLLPAGITACSWGIWAVQAQHLPARPQLVHIEQLHT